MTPTELAEAIRMAEVAEREWWSGSGQWLHVHRDELPKFAEAILAAFSPGPAAEPLDVEQLARALHRWEARHDPEREDVSAIVGVAIYEDGDLQTAQEIATEYAALPTQASDSPEPKETR